MEKFSRGEIEVSNRGPRGTSRMNTARLEKERISIYRLSKSFALDRTAIRLLFDFWERKDAMGYVSFFRTDCNFPSRIADATNFR